MNSLIITNATISTPLGHEARKGEKMAHIHTIENGAVIVKDGIISYVGSMADMPKVDNPESYQHIDAGGRALLPGFVDSHTHLIFGGYRPDEFEWRLKGDSYMSIMERGGGIQSTVNATRGESVDNFVAKAQWFINRMVEMGVTTVEAKSGYGLDTETELKMLDAIDRLAKDPDQKLNVVIIDFDDEKKRIALGLKQLTPHPWDALDPNLKVGDKVHGKVVVMADYGAFIEIAPGVEGLIHVSEMSWSAHLHSAQEFMKVGDEVDAVILTLDREERKMSLGVKQLKEDPWE